MFCPGQTTLRRRWLKLELALHLERIPRLNGSPNPKCSHLSQELVTREAISPYHRPNLHVLSDEVLKGGSCFVWDFNEQ